VWWYSITRADALRRRVPPDAPRPFSTQSVESDRVGADRRHESYKSHKTMQYILQKSVDVIGEYDVVIAGGGLAGYGALIKACEQGCKTLLIERSSQLGGIGVLAGVGNFCYVDKLTAQGKVFDDILNRLRHLHAIDPEHGWPMTTNDKYGWVSHRFDHNILPIVLQHLAEQHHADLLFQTEVIDVIKDGDHLAAAVIHNRSLTQAVKARVFIDATGDGILSQHAGALTLPVEDQAYPDLIPPSMMMYLLETATPQQQPVLAEREQDFRVLRFSYLEYPDELIEIKYALPKRFDTGSGKGFSEADQTARRTALPLVKHLQETKNPRVRFLSLPFQLGLREGRRIQGDYILTIKDIESRATFEDSVAYGAFTVDTYNDHWNVPPYQIPYRSLIVKGLDNLLVVGRCASMDRLAMSSARIMATCCMMGQAAGLGAAFSIQEQGNIRNVKTDMIRQQIITGAVDAELLQARLGGP